VSIYRMVLTTPYCTVVDSTGQRLEFRLNPAVLRVNKQICAEATEVLYHMNQFVIFKINRPPSCLKDIPAFELLSEDRIPRPLLRVDIDSEHHNSYWGESTATTTCITTSNGIPSIISTIWNLGKVEGALFIMRMKLSLNFTPKASAKYEFLSNLVLRPWKNMNGVKELELSDDIKQPMADHLELHILEGPFLNDVTEFLEQQRSLAEGEYRQRNLNHAQWQWAKLCGYWDYIHSLEPHLDRGRRMTNPDNDGKVLEHLLEMTYPIYLEARLGLVKIALHQSEYDNALWFANTLVSLSDRRNLNKGTLMVIKFTLSRALAFTASGKIRSGMEELELAARSFCYLFRSGRYGIKTETEILEEFKSAVENELIRRNSMWRCNAKEPLSVEGKPVKDWELRKVCRSLWEWLDEPEYVPEVGSEG
jgi:hypothetical protein